jgi:hypothetical protein
MKKNVGDGLQTVPQIVLAALFALLVGATTLFAQSFDLRTGTWEFTMTVQGAIPMDGIPPAMRAQMEAEMRKPQTFKSCVTAEDVKDLRLGKKSDDDDDEDCKVVSSKMTRTTGDIVRECTGDEPQTETSHYEAATPQALKATIASKKPGGTMTMNVVGKWLAARCTE